jgi:tRNA A37 methylthiotransferase MiaB
MNEVGLAKSVQLYVACNFFPIGCMAERLKNKIVEVEKMVDVVCGPDAYRALPRMLALTESGQTAGLYCCLFVRLMLLQEELRIVY